MSPAPRRSVSRVSAPHGGAGGRHGLSEHGSCRSVCVGGVAPGFGDKRGDNRPSPRCRSRHMPTLSSVGTNRGFLGGQLIHSRYGRGGRQRAAGWSRSGREPRLWPSWAVFWARAYVALHAEQQAASRRLQGCGSNPASGGHTTAQRITEGARRFPGPEGLVRRATIAASRRSRNRPMFRSWVNMLTAKRSGEGSVPRAALEEHLRFLRPELSEAAQVLLELVPIQEEQAPWETFRRAHQFQPGHEGVWGWCYEELAEQGAESKPAAASVRLRNARGRSSPWGSPSHPSICAILTPASISAARLVSDTTWRTAEMNRLRSGVDEAQRVVAQLSAEKGRRHRAL